MLYSRISFLASAGSVLGLAALFMAGGGRNPVAAQEATPLRAAAQATELPLGPWGPYARAHSGPCYLANRLLSHLFAFPIVVSQRREEIILRSVKMPDGKTRTRFEKAVLMRRSQGLAPIQAESDDKSAAPGNRRARIVAGNADGLFWGSVIPFAPAALAQNAAAPPGSPAPRDWGAGEAKVEAFPAFTEPAADGLLVRVTVTNQSDAPQTYCIDLLGGMDEPGPQFAFADLSLTTQSKEGNAVIVRHGKSDFVMAMAASTNRFPLRAFRVSDAYFSPEGAVTQRDGINAVQPPGLLPPEAAKKPKPKRRDAKNSETPPPATDDAESRAWGLVRVDDIEVAPGQSQTFFLAVGVAGDADRAHDSALTLLSVAEDAMPFGKPREGAYTQAVAAHRKARYNAGDAALERLMAQSVANIPFVLTRRVGAPTREDTAEGRGGQYRPGAGGMIALGWTFYRPEWAAAQLNAFFLTRSNPDRPIARPQAEPPTNFFALWELYQRTQDREMLARFYPFARRRYRELLEAGRPTPETWLFAWPADAKREAAFVNRLGMEGAESLVFAPEYSAYVARAARVMRRMAEQTQQKEEEIAQYGKDASEAARALKATLWNAERGLFLPKASAPTAKAPQAETIFSLMPLLLGPEDLTAEQQAALLKHLSDPARFWSEAGLRSVAKSSPAYRPDAERGGAIHAGPNWLLWKALLDLSETETAQRLAENLLQAYGKAQAASQTCPAWLHGDTGAAGGVADFSGDMMALIPLHAAYHTPGTVSTGWDTEVLERSHDAARDTLRVVFRAPEKAQKAALLCVMGQPNGRYTLSGAVTQALTADASGLLTVTVSGDAKPQELNIAPAAPKSDA